MWEEHEECKDCVYKNESEIVGYCYIIGEVCPLDEPINFYPNENNKWHNESCIDVWMHTRKLVDADMPIMDAFEQASHEHNIKHWTKMSGEEKIKVFRYAIKTKQAEDTFEGFSKCMSNSTFDVKTGKPVEII